MARSSRLLERGVAIRVEAVSWTPPGASSRARCKLSQTSGFTSRETGGLQDAEERVLGNLAEGLLLELLVDLEADRARTPFQALPARSGP